MPRRNLYVLLAAIAAAILIAILVIAACGGDDNGDDDDDNGESEPTVSVRPTNEPEESPDGTAQPSGDDKTQSPEATPAITEDPGPTPIPATPNPSGIRATVIENPQAWFAENYPGVSPGQEACDYSQVTVLVTCNGVDYAPDPPLVAAGVECAAFLVNNERIALRCHIPDVTTYFYDIQE